MIRPNVSGLSGEKLDPLTDRRLAGRIAAGGALAQALTPVYPTVAALPQVYLRKAVLAGLGRADLSDTVPADAPPLPGVTRPLSLRQALEFLHQPTPDVPAAVLEDRSHPAWQRLKAEELLAQQLSQLRSRREHERLRARPLSAGRRCGW